MSARQTVDGNSVETQQGLSWKLQCAVFASAALFVFARRPDLLLHAHFYAEDGARWYAQAYNLGWLHALTITAGGYLNTLQRLVATLSLLVPIRWAPTLMNVCGLVVQVLPACFLLSSRCARWWPLQIRLLQAALYVVLPNEREVHVLLTNAPFHLALLAFLVAVAKPPENWGWKIFDVLVLAVSALSGPFCIVLFPLVVGSWWLRRERWRVVVMSVLLPLIGLQAAELVFGGYADRFSPHLGATPLLFFRLLAGHIFMGSLWGENGFARHNFPVASVLVSMAGIGVLVFAFRRCTLELRLFIVFAFVLLAGSLKRPLIDGPLPQWELLTIVASGRYWFMPMLAFLWSLLFCATQSENQIFRIGTRVVFLTLLRGIVHDHRYPPYPGQNFQVFLQKFADAKPGALVEVPDPPPNEVDYLKKK